MKTNKIRLKTTLKLLKRANACDNGMKTLLKSLPVNYSETKPINLLHILESNGLQHFFWAWRATSKSEKYVKRLILADIVESVEKYYLNTYPNSTIISDIVKELHKKRLNIKNLYKLRIAAAYTATVTAAAYTATDTAANNAAAYSVVAAAANAAYAAANATSTVAAAAYAAYAAAAANDAVAAAAYAAAAANAAYAAAAATAAKKQETQNQINIIYKYLR